MSYCINISKNGFHYFATADQSLTTESTAHVVYNDLKSKYLAADGFEVTIEYWDRTGKDLTNHFERGRAVDSVAIG